MKKLTIPVSGARVGDAVRPVASRIAVPVRSQQLGLRVHTSPLVPAAPKAAFGPEDYATADDYDTPVRPLP